MVTNLMERHAIETLLYFLSKVYVPPAQQDQFLTAVQQLESLLIKADRAA